MPIYEFRCQECQALSEFQLKLADPHPQDCPACGRPSLKKIMSLPSFQLKGGGWYSDAYDGRSNKKSESPATPAAAPAAPAAPAADTSAPKTESKPAPSAGSSSEKAKT